MTDLDVLQFIALKMLYAVICGAVVGYERRINFSPAGFKTQILVCVGAMLFTVSPHIAGAGINEVPRVIGQIVTGIGFLGAGTIIRNSSQSVSGLTTAAWIWFTAAIGIMIGLGFGGAALFTAITLTGVITLVRKFEKRVFGQRYQRHGHQQVEEKIEEIRKAG
jgi:putative Mg2+ transporter-C (MgtC) family protein